MFLYLSITKNKNKMKATIKLQLTEKEAQALILMLDVAMRETASEMRQFSPVKDPLWFAHLRDQYHTAERIYNNLREPELA